MRRPKPNAARAAARSPSTSSVARALHAAHPATRVYPGDLLRFTYSNAAPAYLALLGRDRRSASVYFPAADQAERVAAGRDQALDFSLELDGELGEERLYCAVPGRVRVGTATRRAREERRATRACRVPARAHRAAQRGAAVKRGAAAALLWLMLPLSVASARVERYAIVIGNNAAPSDEAVLRYAEADASKVRDVLRDLGGYEPANMVLLRGEKADTARSTLIALNDRIREATSKPDTDVVLFVYYSGHADGERLHMSGTALGMTELAQLVRGSAAQFRLRGARRMPLRRAHAHQGRARASAVRAADGAAAAGEGVAFLTATSDNEDAQESDALRGSFFTHAFVSGLLGAADRDRDGRVVLEEAYRYAYEATLRATSRTLAGTQHASFRYDFRGTRRHRATRARTRTRRARDALHFPPTPVPVDARSDRRTGRGRALRAHAENRQLSLRPGAYFVRVRAPDVMYEGTLDAAPAPRNGRRRRLQPRSSMRRLVRKGRAGAAPCTASRRA